MKILRVSRTIGVIAVCCSFMGCSNKAVSYDKVKEVEAVSGYREWSPVTKGDSGYYYASGDKSKLYHFETMATEPEALCNKSDCYHDTNECDSYVSGLVAQSLCYADHHLFYLARNKENGITKMSLFKIDKNGENKEKLTNLYNMEEEEYSEPVSILHKGYLYYIKDEIVTNDNEDQIISKLYRTKIEKGASSELVYDGKECMIANLKAKGNSIYFEKSQSDKAWESTGELIKMSVESKAVSSLYKYSGKNYVTSFELVDDSLLCAVMGKGVIKINLDTLLQTVFYSDMQKSENGLTIFYDGTYIYEENQIGCEKETCMEDEEDRLYKNSKIYVRDKNGKLVDTLQLFNHGTMLYGGDSKYLFIDGFGRLKAYDKSNIGTGKGKFVYVD